MEFFNSIIKFILDLVFRPFETAAPWIGLLVISIVSGVGLLFVFKLIQKSFF